MFTELVTIIIIGIVVFELIEHILFPLLWSLIRRKRESFCGAEGIPGKLVVVQKWHFGEGRVLLEGEIWKAIGCDFLRPGEKAVVQKIDGLILTVAAVDSMSFSSEKD